MSWWLSFARNKRMFIVNHEYFVHSNELKHDIGRGLNKRYSFKIIIIINIIYNGVVILDLPVSYSNFLH